MALMQAYIHPVKQSAQGMAEPAFGFALANRFTPPAGLPWAEQDRAQKMYLVLQAQTQLVARFWGSGYAAWDLRLIKMERAESLTMGLLCRMPYPAHVAPAELNRECQAAAQEVQILFREFGYDLSPLSSWPAFSCLLRPFDYRWLAEIRRGEELIEIDYAHETYEFYVTYPWQWNGTTRQRVFDALTRAPDNCLVSVCLQPTRLRADELQVMQRVLSGSVRNELLHAGSLGQEALQVYEGFMRDLQQPFLLRIALAASSAATLEHVGQALLDELEPAGNTQGRPQLQYPRNPYELQALQQSLFCLEWAPWGNLRDGVPQTARLRYLVESKEASMAFRLPITEERRAVILTALPVEYMAVRVHLSEVREEECEGTLYERGSFTGARGRWEIVIAQATGAGGAGTAVEAERAIAYFKPHVILFVGIAGGLKAVAPGDVVVATKVYGYEAARVEEHGLRSRPEVGQSSHLMVQRASAEARKTDWQQRLQGASPIASSPRIFVGPIAAGDKDFASTRAELYGFLQTTYEDALAIEMQGHGFLQATYRHSGMEALIVRGISGLISNRRHVEDAGHQETAARHASAFAFEVLAKLDTQPR